MEKRVPYRRRSPVAARRAVFRESGAAQSSGISFGSAQDPALEVGEQGRPASAKPGCESTGWLPAKSHPGPGPGASTRPRAGNKLPARGRELAPGPGREIAPGPGPGLSTSLLVDRLAHRYIDRARFPDSIDSLTLQRWLLRKKGSSRIGALAKRLCPTLDCSWEPSEQMPQRPPAKRKLHEDRSSFVMATVTWNIIYLLHAATHRPRGRESDAEKKVAEVALQMLVALTQVAALHCPEELRSFRTYFGNARLLRSGGIAVHEDDDGAWLNTRSSDSGATCKETTARTLKHWCLLAYRPREREVAQSIATPIMYRLAVGFFRWARQQVEPTTNMLLALQQPHSKTHPALALRLLQKKKKHAPVRQWREDGLKVKPSVRNLEDRVAAQHLHQIHRMFGDCRILRYGWPDAQHSWRRLPFVRHVPAIGHGAEPSSVGGPGWGGESRVLCVWSRTVELVLDSTRFATRDTQVTIAYMPEAALAAYLPPMVCRQLRWREAAAGDYITDKDWNQFVKTGFRIARCKPVVGLLGLDAT